jgi:ribose transport system permease protein
MIVDSNTTMKKKSGFKTFINKITRAEEFGILISLIAIGVVLSFVTEQFALPANLIQVLRQSAYVATMAVGMLFVISQGDIDISVAAIYNLSVIVMAFAMEKGMSPSLTIPFGIIVGSFLGLVNGLLMISLKLPALIITLGTMTIYKSLSLVLSNATTIAKFPNKEHWFFTVVGGKIFGGNIHASVIIMLIVAVIGYILYVHTKFGRHVNAVGANRRAAQYAGLKVDKIRVLSMTLCGAIAAIAGMGTLAFLRAADPSFGAGSEMMVIASTIIGGASLAGGSGSIVGAIIGALLVSVIRNGLTLLGISPYWQGAITGVTIIGAVALDYIIKRRRIQS